MIKCKFVAQQSRNSRMMTHPSDPTNVKTEGRATLADPTDSLRNHVLYPKRLS